MNADERRRLERRAAGGDLVAKRQLDDYRRAVAEAERERREALENVYPTIRDLRALFRPEHARKASVLRRLLDGRLDPVVQWRRFPATRRWLEGFAGLPSSAAIALRAASEIVGGSIERLECRGRHGADENVHAVFVCTGDPYAEVLIRSLSDRQWLVMAWEDYVRREARKGWPCFPRGGA